MKMTLKDLFYAMKILLSLFLLFFTPAVLALSLEKLFYVTADVGNNSFSDAQLEQIKTHAASIDILAPQIYELDAQGVISGDIDSRILAIAKENNLKIMPLIVNPDFNQDSFHLFLQDPSAIERAVQKMLALCEQYHFYGIQFDFENININDKDKLTDFFQQAATRLHSKGYMISVAVVPRSSDFIYNDYERWYFENWSGAYDYKALGQSADFISVMSYDRHTSLTTPGPIAPHDWVENTLLYLLKSVPANKISLGVPSYSGFWSTGKLDPGNIPERYIYRSKEMQISYSKAISLLKESNQSLVWQDQWQSFYVMYSNHDRNEFLFVEDAKAFQAKMELASRYQLRGISVWKLGLEDPDIWNHIT